MKKMFKINSDNGYVMQNGKSVAFLAKIPMLAVIDGVIVNGEYLEDIFDIAADETTPDVKYPRYKEFDGYRVCAVIFVKGGVAESELLSRASIGDINEFVVVYHEECITEV